MGCLLLEASCLMKGLEPDWVVAVAIFGGRVLCERDGVLLQVDEWMDGRSCVAKSVQKFSRL
jgi:hypothetical protein